MKALVYGKEKLYKKLTAQLYKEGIEMKKAGYQFYKEEDFADKLYDLAIVDSSCDTAATACAYIRNEWDIPIILVVNPRQANWKGIIPMDADGYILEVKTDSEFAARARALLRRLFLLKTTPDKAENRGLSGEDCVCAV
jgi:DNA-binding response OmpR family regulator